MYQNDMIERFKYFIAAFLISLIAAGVYVSIPKNLGGTDEWVYHRQAKFISTFGFEGFKALSNDYINNPMMQDAPPPLRIAAVLGAYTAVSFEDSPRSIAVFCLLNFILLLGCTFLFIKRFFTTELALLVVLLMGISPLEMAISRRALMDMPAFTVTLLSFYAFWLTATSGKLKYRIAFILLAAWAILMKEVYVVMLGFYGLAMLFLLWKRRISLSFISITLLIISPVILCLLIWTIVLGYDTWFTMATILQNAASHSKYSALYGQGPWHRLLLDYTLLSPVVMLLAIGYSGYLLAKNKTDILTLLIILLGVYVIGYLSILPKNVRYGVLLDFPLRFLAANAVLSLLYFFHSRKRLGVALWLVVILVAIDIKSFYFFFIENDVYDTISYNLLKVAKIIP